MSVVFLLIGFVLLINGANFFVDGSSAVARALKVPAVVIGLTVVAIGTSAPEAAVSISASIKGNSDISVSNIIGSDIFNLIVIAGLCSVIRPLSLDRKIINRDFPVMILSSLLLTLFSLNRKISMYEGAVFVLLIVSYMIILVKEAKKQRANYKPEENTSVKKEKPLPINIILLLAGIGMIIWGGNLVVDNACKIAQSLGVSHTLIGLTVIAAGTSLPELVTSLVALKKGENGLAIGNVIGSNIFNIAAVLGISSVIRPLSVNTFCLTDCIAITSVMILIYISVFKKHTMTRITGACCLGCYALYMAYAIIR